MIIYAVLKIKKDNIIKKKIMQICKKNVTSHSYLIIYEPLKSTVNCNFIYNFFNYFIL